MSDIPVGSPPVPPGRHAAPGGWYADPLDQTQERYWDGWQWSRTTRPREGAAPAANAAWPPAGQAQPAPAGSAPYNPYGYPTAPSAATGSARATLLTADGVPVSTWWWRALAAILDSLFTGVLSSLLSLPFYASMFSVMSAWYGQAVQAARTGAPPPPTPDVATLLSGTNQVLISLIALTIGMVYQVVFLRLRGATPGKLVCGLRVVPVEQGRFSGRLPWTAVVVRAAIWVVPGVYSVLFIVRIVDALLPLRQPRRQALHDLAAKTQVVRPGR